MRPCTCDRTDTCRRCWLYHHDPRYTRLWDHPTAPISTHPGPDVSYLINLERRPDRRKQADQQFKRAGIPYTLVAAVDGTAVPVPPDWTVEPGGYGCLLSHMSALEKAIAAGHRTVAVYEDDVQLVDYYRPKLNKFLEQVTELDPDWQHFMCGGQHLSPPEGTANPEILRCTNTHRTHAYVTRDPAGLYQMWSGGTKHVDAVWGDHQPGQRVYCPRTWLAAQGPGLSDINGLTLGYRDWPVRQVQERPKLRAVPPRKPCGTCRGKAGR